MSKILTPWGDTEKYLDSCKKLNILSEFLHSKLACLITCVQIMIEKAQPNPYDGDSNTRHQPTDSRR